MEKVIVRVPASTSNLGPGYDCLGVALRLHNSIGVSRAPRRKLPEIFAEAADCFFAAAAIAPFGFSSQCMGDVPISRGLGSSVTIRLGLLLGLNTLAPGRLSRQRCFELCAGLEGHPDNAAPAAFGGFNVIHGQTRQRFAVSSRLRFVLLIPPFEIRTEDARNLLPVRINRAAAVTSTANACALTAALASGDFEPMRGAFADHLHQPFRKALLPFFDDVVVAAENAGALGAFLSGSGSTIAAVTTKNAAGVAAAMLAAADRKGARTIVTIADNRGAFVVSKNG